jgi:hypothetical protein
LKIMGKEIYQYPNGNSTSKKILEIGKEKQTNIL